MSVKTRKVAKDKRNINTLAAHNGRGFSAKFELASVLNGFEDNLLIVSKVVSARVLTGRMVEERSHQVGEFLQSAQRPQDPLLQLCLGLRHFLGDLLFDVTSHQFIRIQLG
ncbi:MAG: hypothetical protein LW860_13940, partial [Xanthomonadaceae bacterium]|nr:hypothetical protein [Xanthomonadaceae bacterium]